VLADEYLVNEAPPRKLLRLRKDELVRLYNTTGLADDAESFTKPELVQAIVSARDDIASLPPSSPPGRPDSISSDYSSDDGNVAGDEETDIGVKYRAPFGLRRRATVNGMGDIGSRALKSRSMSMGQLNVHSCPETSTAAPKVRVELNGGPRYVACKPLGTCILITTGGETHARFPAVRHLHLVLRIIYHHHPSPVTVRVNRL